MRSFYVTKAINPFRQALFWQQGYTHLYVTCSLENNLPNFLKGSGSGWIHIEYALSPGSTPERVERERKGPSGRTLEIQRFLSRVFRSMASLENLGEKTLKIDVEVLSADGSTRAAALNAAYLLAKSFLTKEKINLFKEDFCALSIGYNENRDILLDLDYAQDALALADFNIALTKSAKVIEIQGCAEKTQLSFEELNVFLEKAKIESAKIFNFYEETLPSLL